MKYEWDDVVGPIDALTLITNRVLFNPYTDYTVVLRYSALVNVLY